MTFFKSQNFNMDTSWKSVYNQTFETPNQATVENPDLFTFEHPNLDNFIHYLSTNKLQGNEPFILSQIIKNEMGEKQRLVDELRKVVRFCKSCRNGVAQSQ